MRHHVHLTIHGGHSQEMAAVGENAWILVEVNVLVFLHLEKVHADRLDVLRGTRLTKLDVWTLFAAERWA